MNSFADSAPIIAGMASVQAEEDETFEAPSEENVEVGHLSDRGGSALLEESEIGRRRRRRRRRRGELAVRRQSLGGRSTADGRRLGSGRRFRRRSRCSTGDDDAFDQKGLRSGEERHRRSNRLWCGRTGSEQADRRSTPETSAPVFDSAPSCSRLRKSSPGPKPTIDPPSSGGAVSHEETTTMRSPVADAKKHEIEAQAATRTAAAERSLASFATAEAVAASETLAAAPSATEPPRPRRSGWWQRARESVIGK